MARVVEHCRVVVDNDFAGDPDGLVGLAHHLLSPTNRVVAITSSFLNPTLADSTTTAADGFALATALVDEVERRAPGTPVVVQSVMPRTARFRDDIRLLNNAYRALVEAAAAHVQYLDLWPALADEQGLLRSAFTEDGLHLGGAGYAAWVDVLRPHVLKVLNGS